MEILKTDLSAFNSITDFKYKARFVDFNNMQMHYIDEGEGEIILALHGEPTWSYLYRKFIPVLGDYRFIAPDFIGFGKSDKLVNWTDYSFELHLQSLINFIDKLNLDKITLIVQDWGGLLGLSLLGAMPEKFSNVVILNTFLPKGKKLPFAFKLWQLFAKHHPSLPVPSIIQKFTFNKLSKDTLEAYKIPFPNKTFKTGPKSFPILVPSKIDDPSIPHLLKAREVLSNWTKPALVMFSDKDFIFSGLEKFFLNLIPFCKDQPVITIRNAGHFLQEDKGEEIANYIKLFLEGKICKKS
ncbi:MAG: alpha/beta fold hydrolase [Saprospiraceae bacterium]|nr:alpha/beta fold hydrolase [Bacteroidia bacterium]NNE16078.1 alpha/beta fold hydrolase [Saprospiraceae bacterium]NNL92535.1 alpha/beta fold hydrolase [Saprospiraceae bacterium]